MTIAWLALPPASFDQSLRAAEKTASDKAVAPIPYRRIFVPSNHMETWPIEGEKYIPVESRDFESWVNSANKSVAAESASVSVDAAEYVGTVDDKSRLHGRGKWSISLRGAKPAFLPLGETSLSIRNPRWQGDVQRPVRLGVWGSAVSNQEKFGLEVPKSGILEFEWSIPANLQQEEFRIPWHVPASLSARLILELPLDKEPVLDGTVVLDSTPTATPAGPKDKNRRQWVLGFDTSTRSLLRITNKSHEVIDSTKQLTLHEETSYRIEQRGLEIVATWHFEGAIDEPRQLAVPLPRGAQLASVAAGGQELDWHIERGDAQSLDKALIALPRIENSRSLQVVANAWCPLALDRAWRLPVLRPFGVFWSSGKAELSVAPEFELRSLNPIDCAQVGAEHIGPAGDRPETYALLAHLPSAAIEIVLAHRQPEASIRAGSSLVLADPDVSGRLVTEWSVARSGLHQLTGEIAAGWNVETVETIPSDALGEWFIDRRGTRRRIEIQLTEAASPARKVSVIIVGRLQRFGLAEPISADVLRMVVWPGARVARHLLTFQSVEPFATETVGNLPVLSRDLVTDADHALLDAGTDDNHIVDLARAGHDSGLMLTFKRGQYSADVEIDASYANNELRQAYRITAHPKANAVDRLLVFASAPLGSGTRWTETSSDSPLVAARLPDDDPQRKDVPQDGELWLVRLPQATTGPIDVRATVTTTWPRRAGLPLIALPEAVQQHGHATIRSASGITPFIEPTGLTPVPLPSLENGAAGTNNAVPIRAAFRFNPVDCLATSRMPRLWIGPGADSGASPLVARYLTLESFFWPDGRGTHQATYNLDNYGATEFKPPLPPGARIRSVSVNGQLLESPIPEGGGQDSTIRLPQPSQPATVSICFDTREDPLRAGCALAPPLEHDAVPLLAGQWTVWLPEEYQASAAGRSADFNWRQRLFGPLARSNGAPPFNPIQPADWSRLLNALIDWQNEPSPQNARPNPAVVGRDTTSNADRASDAGLPTKVSAQQDTLAARPSGWQAFHEAFVADGAPEPIVILHPAKSTALAVALLLSSFLIGRWLCRDRGVLLVAMLAICASLALLLPVGLAPLATGIMWGLVCAALAEWPRHLLAPRERSDVSQRRIAVTGTITVLVVIGLTKPVVAQPQGAQPITLPIASHSAVERVLIPVDAQKRPAGSKYYVSERFLRTLLNPPSEMDQSDRKWLLRDAAYSGELAVNQAQTDATSGTWTLAFGVETFSRHTRIGLPLVRDEAIWQPTAMLDGVPVPISWRDSQRQCDIEIDQPGRYSLAIVCVPKIKADSEQRQINLAIPRLPLAAIQLHASEGTNDIRVEGATLTPPSKEMPGVLIGELVQTDHITVRWPRIEAKTGASQSLTATQLSWLHVGPAETELETKFLIEGAARRPETLTISYDEHWQLVSDATPPGNERPSDNTRRRSIPIRIAAQEGGHQEVSLRWKLIDAVPVGNFRLPPIQVTSLAATQRWFAISSAPSLECTVLNDTSTTVATAKEFLTKWGNSADDSTPQVVFADSDPGRGITLVVRPYETEVAVRESLHVAIGNEAMRVFYQANVIPGNQDQYQFQLTVPANLVVDEVTLNQTDRHIPARWTRDSENHINVFFGEGLAADFRVSLSGHVPIDDHGKNPLPRVASATLASGPQQVQLYRDDDVHVELSNLSPTEDSNAGPAELPPVQWLVRPLGVYQLDAAAADAARITIQPNKATTTGHTLTTISRDAGAWSATFRCRLVVDSGDLDILRLRVPVFWAGPFDVESSVPASLEQAPLDEHFQNVTIRFAKSVSQSGHVDLRIRGPLAAAAGMSVAAPDIWLTPSPRGQRYLIVPNAQDAHPIAWTETGVRAGQVPSDLLPGSIDLDGIRQFEITNATVQVAVRPQSASQPAPRIRIADVVVAAGRRGGQVITTRLIVSSDGLPDCTLQLPAQQQLVSITLDGRQALATVLDQSSWRVALGAAQLPQSLVIISRVAANDSSPQTNDLQRPTLLAGDKQLPADVSLWTLAEDRPATRRAIDGAAPVSAVDQAALRLDRLVSIAESATASATEAPSPDGENWFRPWATLLKSVQQQTAQIVERTPTEAAVAQVSRGSEEQIDRATKRLEHWLQQVGKRVPLSDLPVPSESLVAIDRSILPQHLFDSPATTCFVAEGGADRLLLDVAPDTSRPLRIQVLALLTISVLATATVWLIRSPIAADFLCRWPHALGIVLGIIYWAWLWPSWLGLVIIAAILWLALRFDWPGQSFRAEASTVLRSTRSH